MKLDGAVALITGASSGIGAATARELAAQGAAVALVARRVDRLQNLVREIESVGGRAKAIAADVTDSLQAAEAVEGAVAEFGRLDILVNNAGQMLLGPFAQAPTTDWDRMVDLNIRAVLSVTRAALPHLVKAAADDLRQVADVVNVSSVAGRKAVAGGAVYALTKYGVLGLTEGLRQELAASRVRVSALEPGAVDTELGDHVNPIIREQILARLDYQPMQAKDVAEVIAFTVTRGQNVAINEILVRPTGQLV
ncbi:SDR family NAD(P)-dependent oxidoreductase [Streptomyces sp. NPDC059985]|uniref:SDR family NAD(P)-dependent oxidoreductase n=1 Tax=Streptomyces sp. NPDC059985 TaxID=3347025 RepID=UPI00369E307C